LLLGIVVVLTAYHWRKKLSFLPLGNVSWWLQGHIYLGMLAVVVFGSHVRWRWPSGWFESILYVLFVLVSGSGLVGLVWTRRIPRRLTKLREEFTFERIPEFRHRLRELAHATMHKLLMESPTSALADFYSRSLLPYLAAPVPWRKYAWCTSRTRNRLRSELDGLGRYCTAGERQVQERFSRMIDQRDDLDFHAVHQGRLRAWLFVHVGLTYTMLVAIGVHAVLVHAFHGS
jgi:hypothetical protein